jgi:O-antigen ligase
VARVTSPSIVPGLARARLVQAADWLAVGVAVSLPWSTSATGIFVALWIIAVVPTLDVGMVRRQLTTAAGLLPVLLWLLAAIGMLWADVTWAERLGGLGKFHRLLVIPLLLMHFRRSERGVWVLYGFFAATLVLLIVSYGLALIPGLPWRGTKGTGVPAKDYIFQSANFLLCAFALLGDACERGRLQLWHAALHRVALALLFLGNIFFIVGSRTAFLVAPVLLLLLGWREFRWKGVVGAALIGCLVGAASWFESPYLHGRLATSVAELEAYRAKDAPNSTGLHLEFLRKSLTFVQTAPIIGHGTGSIGEQFRNSALGHEGASSTLSENPHNQIFAVAIQLGLVGTVVLLAMWIAHLLLFVRGGDLTAWIGTIVVVENVVSSLFNSHLFDFTSGWLYVFGVGVAGGMVLRQHDAALASARSPPLVS